MIPYEVIDVVGIWMIEGSTPDGVEWLKQIENLIPVRFKIYSGDLYRVYPYESLALPRRPRSWSKSLEVVEKFLNMEQTYEDMEKDEGPRILISKVSPALPSRVIIDLEKFMSDPEVIQSIKKYKKQGKIIHSGLDFGSSQQEVIYDCTVRADKAILHFDPDKDVWLPGSGLGI